MAISKEMRIPLAMFHFILWFSIAFLTLDTFPIIMFIAAAIILAIEVTFD